MNGTTENENRTEEEIQDENLDDEEVKKEISKNERVLFTPDKIQEVNDNLIEWVDIQEWGEGAGVYIKRFTSAGKDGFENYVSRRLDTNKKEGMKEIRARLCALSMCDENGKLLFDNVKGGIAVLQEKSSSAINTIFERCQKINKMRPEDMEASIKNLGTTQTDNSN